MDKEKIENFGRGFVWTVLLISFLFSLFAIYNTITREKEYSYTLVLDGVEVDSLDVCSKDWSYENLTSIPCVDINLSLGGGIMAPFINWSISPQENCESHGWVFPGFNILNKSRSEELYRNILPKCNTLTKEEVILPWIKGQNCKCIENKKPEKCRLFKCNENLFIEQKW